MCGCFGKNVYGKGRAGAGGVQAAELNESANPRILRDCLAFPAVCLFRNALSFLPGEEVEVYERGDAETVAGDSVPEDIAAKAHAEV